MYTMIKTISKPLDQYFLPRKIPKSLPAFSTEPKPALGHVLTPKSNSQLKILKPKRPLWRASQKDLKQWQDDLDRISKEESSVKRSLKSLNLKFQNIISKKHENLLNTEEIEEKKQKEIERSLVYIDGLLKDIRKKYKNHI